MGTEPSHYKRCCTVHATLALSRLLTRARYFGRLDACFGCLCACRHQLQQFKAATKKDPALLASFNKLLGVDAVVGDVGDGAMRSGQTENDE